MFAVQQLAGIAQHDAFIEAAIDDEPRHRIGKAIGGARVDDLDCHMHRGGGRHHFGEAVGAPRGASPWPW